MNEPDHEDKLLHIKKSAKRELVDWIEVLVRGRGDVEKRLLKLCENRNLFSAILELRRQLFSEGRGMIEPAFLKYCYYNNQECFRLLLEEMFLEPISVGYLKTINKSIVNNNWHSEDLTQIHNANPETRIWKIINRKNKCACGRMAEVL